MSSTTHPYFRPRQDDHDSSPPKIEARFFYTSPLPIDDPLSPVPPPATGQIPGGLSPQPFSEYDNIALERAWLKLRDELTQFRKERGEKLKADSKKRSISNSSIASRRRSGELSSRPPTRNSEGASSSVQHGKTSQLPIDSRKDALLHSSDAPSVNSEPNSLPDTTGTPFIRAPSRKKVISLNEERQSRPKFAARDTYLWDDDSHLVEHSSAPASPTIHEASPHSKVPVGISRLHHVEMPSLEMTPIYWEPVHDEAPVIRGTWFYEDTMIPVEQNVANMLEAGYVDLRVWTDTWKDELRSAVAVGSLGEEKIVHKLWPEKPSQTHQVKSQSMTPGIVTSSADDSTKSPEETRDDALDSACKAIDAATAETGYDNKSSACSSYSIRQNVRTYGTYGVVYANERQARLLKPSLLPSDYYGRRPLAHYILRDRKLGISVVRGFDQKVWDKLHPTKDDIKTRKAESGVSTSGTGADPAERYKSDPALAKSIRPQVTDLVLVIHGIGQKLSRRMESWHFTHAMNSFRREVNVEMGNKDVQRSFREEMGGIMVLPINWRHSLSLEDGGYEGPEEESDVNGFTLKDITPDTLSSVRNIVSDVMLDIPYYMSHHQPKMIAAVVSEANRVYKLWCHNNPGFEKGGRVHIIAHSLGSVMAIDILSRQPTTVQPDQESETDSASKVDDNCFHFDTSNLFLAGSPAGFFLLLRKAQLLPRIDSLSATADSDPSSNTRDICGEQGQYGCVAVENIYNIVNGYDPVAYRMNAAVDAVYAGSLKKANIPSAVAGWFGRRDSTSWFSNSGSSGGTTKPVLPRLPSNVELETHNFTREEIAEKRMFLLNDNGQIDYHVRYGGGPLEIQYLTMLSAHSSYWLLKDFTRMIVLEVGRRRGKDGALMNMRAVKKKAQLT